MTSNKFLAAFEACTLAREKWTHEAHVRMAWLYLTRSPFEDALARVRSGIRKLNAEFIRQAQEACAGDRGEDGYHDTITVALVRVIASRLTAGEDYPSFRARNPDLFDRTLAILHEHYTAELLRSVAAKAEFHEPDLKDLPVFNALA